ncbi:adenylate/guanylate cyclase domain-containing protein [Desulfonatronovibrio magnus]|uniref:adenylate/guanylate cyclase domain-containing protein n=1 Tax=Desulfonatronovibrio magnus TaxID=698827 RepID=UPI0018DB372D|nr:adenylate/guanylate cyclase domain-containing protein [Desulfonatronovibrio magnus]
MSSNSQHLAVLFADITSSRQIFSVLGDERAHKFISKCLAMLADITVAHQGRVVKTIGDEVMCVFPNADYSIEAAVKMHQSMAAVNCPRGLSFRPGIHIGLEAGWVVSSEKDVFGETVILASRLVAKSKTGQILTSGLTVEKLSPAHKSMIRKIQVTSLKGLSQEVSIYEIIWEHEDLTVMLNHPLDLLKARHKFRLVHAGKTIILTSSNPVITLGRHSSCDVRMDEIVVSRIHAKIELRSGKVYLKDQSTNGTFVTFKGSKKDFAHQNELELSEDGCLGLGRQADLDSPDSIIFFTD